MSLFPSPYDYIPRKYLEKFIIKPQYEFPFKLIDDTSFRKNRLYNFPFFVMNLIKLIFGYETKVPPYYREKNINWRKHNLEIYDFSEKDYDKMISESIRPLVNLMNEMIED